MLSVLAIDNEAAEVNLCMCMYHANDHASDQHSVFVTHSYVHLNRVLTISGHCANCLPLGYILCIAKVHTELFSLLNIFNLSKSKNDIFSQHHGNLSPR